MKKTNLNTANFNYDETATATHRTYSSPLYLLFYFTCLFIPVEHSIGMKNGLFYVILTTDDRRTSCGLADTEVASFSKSIAWKIENSCFKTYTLKHSQPLAMCQLVSLSYSLNIFVLSHYPGALNSQKASDARSLTTSDACSILIDNIIINISINNSEYDKCTWLLFLSIVVSVIRCLFV